MNNLKAIGKPKGIIRDVGGAAIGLSFQMANTIGIKYGERYFSTADIGWVVGHSFTVYGPLLKGAATVIYEGKPNIPDPAVY